MSFFFEFSKKISIFPSEIHVWSSSLVLSNEKTLLGLLSKEECDRAKRFRFPLHRQRFISSRAILRKILSFYLDCLPQHIEIAYTEHGKPFLASTNSILQFNLSHSENIAVYAFTLTHAIGIDIEKISERSHEAIAKRFFSPIENEALSGLSPEKQMVYFYRIWSRKEALVKAMGQGLSIPLSTFSVSIHNDFEIILLENEKWSIISLPIKEGFQSALATNQPIQHIQYWHFNDCNPSLDNVYLP